MEALEEDLMLTRKIIGLPKTPASGGQQLRLISKLSEDIAITDYFMWKDGKEIFNTNTSHLRRMLNKTEAQKHVVVDSRCRESNRNQPDMQDDLADTPVLQGELFCMAGTI